MKNEKAQVLFTQPENKQQGLTLRYQEMIAPYLDCFDLYSEYEAGWLIKKKHKHLQSRFNLSEVVPYALLCFKENGDFESVVISNSATKGQFEVLQTASIFVLIPLETFVKIGRVSHLQFQPS